MSETSEKTPGINETRPTIKVFYSEDTSQTNQGNIDVHFYDENDQEIWSENTSKGEQRPENITYKITIKGHEIGTIQRNPRDGFPGRYVEKFIPKEGIQAIELNTAENPNLYPKILVQRGETRSGILKALETTNNQKQKTTPSDIQNLLAEMQNSYDKKVIIEVFGGQFPYARQILGMKREELQEEIARLENSTKDYTKASGEELDWQWPPYAKKQASEDLKRLTFVKTVLKKYDELEALRRINLDDAAIIEETSKKEIN